LSDQGIITVECLRRNSGDKDEREDEEEREVERHCWIENQVMAMPWQRRGFYRKIYLFVGYC
jgi:hypothetical protein